ncbi:MAG TPA: SAVED domain-containing protein [Acidobacteriota bacterium]|nr:SAVED domain-containing protein [Acidobacteriota bacterium]
MMEYRNFSVEIRPESERLKVSTTSHYDVHHDDFDLPLRPDEIEKLLTELARIVPESQKAQAKPPNGNGAPDIEAIGRKLLRSFMTSAVTPAFYRCLGNIEGMENRVRQIGLRLRMGFVGFEDSGAPKEVISLPWELLLDPFNGRFLSLSVFTPVVRFLKAPCPAPITVEPPIKVLVVKSEPEDLPRLHYDDERRSIVDELQANSDLEVDYLDNPDVRTLRRCLREKRPHVLHYSGHGKFDAHSGEGSLALVGPERKHVPVSGKIIAEQIHDCSRDLRLVLLNTCYGSALPRQRGQDAYSGVASALIKAEIPAVVAMQFPITSKGAIAFSRGFYSGLANGDAVDTALVEGRLEMRAANSSSLEWITPVLFMSSEHGRLMKIVRADKPTKEEERRMPGEQVPVMRGGTPISPTSDPLRLCIRSFDGHGVAQDREADHVLDLRRFFDGRRIRRRDLWKTEIYPLLLRFLRESANQGRRLHLHLPAHSTIAFAAGYCLEAKSGVDMTIVQGGQIGTRDWRQGPGDEANESFWKDEDNTHIDADASDVAVAISLTHPIGQDVEYFLQQRSDLKISRILPATLSPAPSSTGVRDWDHSLALAQQLEAKIRSRSIQERLGVLHVFAAAPKVFLFHLGQLARSFGPLQLYEHDFDSSVPAAYEPSLRLPLKQTK